jgi:hypothetical protein
VRLYVPNRENLPDLHGAESARSDDMLVRVRDRRDLHRAQGV